MDETNASHSRDHLAKALLDAYHILEELMG
jgi:hypothetical protein